MPWRGVGHVLSERFRPTQRVWSDSGPWVASHLNAAVDRRRPSGRASLSDDGLAFTSALDVTALSAMRIGRNLFLDASD